MRPCAGRDWVKTALYIACRVPAGRKETQLAERYTTRTTRTTGTSFLFKGSRRICRVEGRDQRSEFHCNLQPCLGCPSLLLQDLEYFFEFGFNIFLPRLAKPGTRACCPKIRRRRSFVPLNLPESVLWCTYARYCSITL